MAIFPGRWTADIEGDFAVFLIGMRINQLWRPDRWMPVAAAMPRMLRELEAAPASGLLGVTSGLVRTGPFAVQYWRSFDDLERYASDPDAEHLPAWRRFNQLVRDTRSVGVWHETYKVRAGESEAVYVNMPRVLLAKAAEHGPIGSDSRARSRLSDAAAPAGRR